MKLTFLGTGSAEGHPNPFCRCAHCEEARRYGGRAIRYRSSALIDDELLIDFGPDLNAASNTLGIPLADIRYAAQTHPHEDHFYVGNFFNRSVHCLVEGAHHIQYTVSPTTAALFREAAAAWLREADDVENDRYPTLRTDLVIHRDWDTVRLGPYSLLAIPASHAPGMEAHIFGIRRSDGPALLYALDTGPMPEGIWERVHDEGWTFHTVVMDHNHGYRENSGVHHSSDSLLAEVGRMRAAGIIDEETRIVATHFAHHSHPDPDALERFTRERGYEPAWDGMVIEV